jgi:DNA-binding MarR family transcriptional regulator
LRESLRAKSALRELQVWRDSADERQVRVKLTEQGRKLQMQASEIVRSVRNATGLQERQVRQLTQEVNALRKELEGHNSR